MEITAFEERYQSQVIDFILRIQQEEFELSISLDEQPDLLDIKKYYPNRFWLATEKEQVIGCIGLVLLDNDNVALKKMFVHSAARQKGVGKLLMVQFMNYCQKCGIHSVFLGTTSRFKAAQYFYQKVGFAEITKDNLPDDFPILDVDDRFYQFHLN
ncbi:GNAT family N-acetyltransferase [Streptococcus merionis]|uniref:GNAT family acetyltransferase n=1 Tax=Streptococcus merionis TaxID=400065 RepID=A0A239SL98_9STRE|nr:GNAT family N-acetyltransferase [Streptococcus merionis]SNU86200.1 GNAT family acetyltransferase [Streptococcus merionis]